MKTEQVTYDKFSQISNKMLENGEKLTIRSIHGRLGGSFGKISEFLKRFEQERTYLNFAKQGDISDQLRQSMLSEVGKAVSEAKALLESQLNQMASHLEEANEQLTEQEKSIEILQEENSALKDKMMLAQQAAGDFESANKDLKHKLDDAQKEKMLAVTDAAKSKLQLERSDQDNHEMKEQIKSLQSRIDLLTQEKYEAEKLAAVAEAKFEQLTQQDKSRK